MTLSSSVLGLAATAMLLITACDADAPLIDDTEAEERIAATPIGGLGLRPYHGRWEGPITQVDGITNNDYDATVVLTPGLCTITGGDVLSAEWDYYNLGVVCTSDLQYLGLGVWPDGTRTWTFYDTNNSGPCLDGLMDLTETADPAVLHYTWRYLDGTVDAEGDVAKNGLCTPGFGS